MKMIKKSSRKGPGIFRNIFKGIVVSKEQSEIRVRGVDAPYGIFCPCVHWEIGLARVPEFLGNRRRRRRSRRRRRRHLEIQIDIQARKL